MPLKSILIIPARMQSARLPGKPLANIAGQPMIAHVVAQALVSGIGPVVVATDDDAIARAATAAGAEAVMTGDHPSGSDRIAEALSGIDPERRYDIVVNLQGDEPEIDPAALCAVLAPLSDPLVDIATLAAPLDNEDRTSIHAVKLFGVTRDEGQIRVRGFARTMPWQTPAAAAWRHIGVYAFRRKALELFVALPSSANEQRERLEQLRALDAGMRIDAALVEHAPRGVDTPADLAAVRARFARKTDK